MKLINGIPGTVIDLDTGTVLGTNIVFVPHANGGVTEAGDLLVDLPDSDIIDYGIEHGTSVFVSDE